MRVAYLDIVTEHVVEADLERRDACGLAFALLDAREDFLAVRGDVPQVVQLDAHSLRDHSAFLNLVRRVGIDSVSYTHLSIPAGAEESCSMG